MASSESHWVQQREARRPRPTAAGTSAGLPWPDDAVEARQRAALRALDAAGHPGGEKQPVWRQWARTVAGRLGLW